MKILNIIIPLFKIIFFEKTNKSFLFSSIITGINKTFFFDGTDGKIFFFSKYLKTCDLLNENLNSYNIFHL